MAKKEESKTISVHVSDSIGSVSALLIEPPEMKALLVLAHGAGAGMQHTFMSSLAKDLAARDVGTLRYNFPYIEQRKNRPDPPGIAEKTVEVLIHHAHKMFPDVALFAGGKSFGGRMTSQRLSKDCPSFMKGIIFFGFPLHAPGKPSTERGDHLKNITIPMLFLQGTRDALAKISLIEEVCNSLPTATLVKLEGADHSFKAGKDILVPALAQQSEQWIKDLMA